MNKIIKRKTIGNETHFAAIDKAHDFFPNMINTQIAVIHGESFIGSENISLMRGLSHFYNGVREIVSQKYPNIDMDVHSNVVTYANIMADEAERLNNQVEDFVCSVYKAAVTGVIAGKKYISVYGINEENVLDVSVILNSPYSSAPYITVSHDETITHYTIDTVGSRTTDGLKVGKKVELEELRYIQPHEQMLVNEAVSVKVFPSRTAWSRPLGVGPMGTINDDADNIMSCVNNFENLFKYNMYDVPGVEPMHEHGSTYRPTHVGYRNKHGYGGVNTRSVVNFAHIQSSLASDFGKTLINKGITVGAITSSLGDDDLLFLGDVIFDEEFYSPNENHTGYAWMTINNITRVLKLHYAKPGMLYPATTTLEHMYGSEMSELVGTKLELQVGEGAVKIYDTFTGQNIGHYDLVNWTIFTTVDNHKTLEREGVIKKYIFGMPEMNNVLLDLKIESEVYTEIFQATTGYVRGNMVNISDHDMITARAIGIRYGEDVHFLVNVIDRLIYVKYTTQENTVNLKISNDNYFDDSFFARVANFEPNFNKGLHLSVKHLSYPDGKNIELSADTKYYIEPSSDDVVESMDDFVMDVENILGVDKDSINVSIENIPSSTVPDMKLTLFTFDRTWYGWNNQTRTICELPSLMSRGLPMFTDLMNLDFKKNLKSSNFSNVNGEVVVNTVLKDEISITFTGFEGFTSPERIDTAVANISDEYTVKNNTIHPLWKKLKDQEEITKDMTIIGTNIPVTDHGIVIDTTIVHAMIGVNSKTRLPQVLIVNTLNNTIEVYEENIITSLNLLKGGLLDKVTIMYNGRGIKYIDHINRIDSQLSDSAILKVTYTPSNLNDVFNDTFNDSTMEITNILTDTEEEKEVTNSHDDPILKGMMLSTDDTIDLEEFRETTGFDDFDVITDGIAIKTLFTKQLIYLKAMLVESSNGEYNIILEGSLDYGICVINKDNLHDAIAQLLLIDEKITPEITISRKSMTSDLDYSLVLRGGGDSVIQIELDYQKSIDKLSSNFEEMFEENNRFINKVLTVDNGVLEDNMFIPLLTIIKDTEKLPALLSGARLLTTNVTGQGSVGKQVVTMINDDGVVVFIIADTQRNKVMYGTISDRLSSINDALETLPNYNSFIIVPHSDDSVRHKLFMLTDNRLNAVELRLDLKTLDIPVIAPEHLKCTPLLDGGYKVYDNDNTSPLSVDYINMHFPETTNVESFKSYLKNQGVDTIVGVYSVHDTKVFSTIVENELSGGVELNTYIVTLGDNGKIESLDRNRFICNSIHYNQPKSLEFNKILDAGKDTLYGISTKYQDIVELITIELTKDIVLDSTEDVKVDDESLKETNTTSFAYTIDEFFAKQTKHLETGVVQHLAREIISDDKINTPVVALKDSDTTIIICSTLKGTADYVMFRYDLDQGAISKYYLYSDDHRPSPDVIKEINYDFDVGYLKVMGDLNGVPYDQILKIKTAGEEVDSSVDTMIKFKNSVYEATHIRKDAVKFINENKLVTDSEYISDLEIDGRYKNTENAILTKTTEGYILLVVHKHKVKLYNIHNTEMLDSVIDNSDVIKYKGLLLSWASATGTVGLRMTELNK